MGVATGGGFAFESDTGAGAMIEERVRELKATIAAHDGQNVAGWQFAREVDELISRFYDDIGAISTVSSRALFDLFVIKTLYVNRRSTDAQVIDYLGAMLERYLFTRELFPIVREGGRRTLMYLSDLLQETTALSHFQNLFEAYRKYGDNALFVTGVFPRSLRRRRGGHYRWSRPAGFVDASYYITTGKSMYRKASEHDLAEFTGQRELLAKLAAYFEIYMDALNEASERYLLGFDMNLIADKMLDAINEYRRSGDERHLENARRYAAILKVDPAAYPRLFERPGLPRLERGF